MCASKVPMLLCSATPHDDNMRDSPVSHFALNLSDSPPKCSKTSRRECNSGGHQLDFVHEFQSDHSVLEVQRMQLQLEEEMELHTVLENAVDHSALTLANISCLPHHEQAKELLYSIATLEITVSNLEEEMVSLQFQLTQERNERRLAEYHLKHSPSQSLYCGSPDNMGKPHSVTSRYVEPSMFEPSHSSGKMSCQKQTDETSETSSRSSMTSLTRQECFSPLSLP